MTATDDRRVEATPEKRFFISMLVKDIELIPSIMDLVDNSVDGARSLRPDGNFDGLRIKIELDPEHFSIEDNCGGIDLETARHYAFRFGRPQGFRGITSSVGQFGVGMKRALFKIGDHFTIESKATESSFKLSVPVKAWAEQTGPDWSFTLDEVSTEKNAVAKCGTVIVVSQLHPQVSVDFARPETASRLAAQISLQHQSALAGGLAMFVNNKALRPAIPRLLVSTSVKPVNYTFTLTVSVEEFSGEVETRIIAGIAAPREQGLKDDGDAEDFPDAGDAGWFVFCNDRLVLAADRTSTTGWGSAGAAYHPQYRRFRGYVFMSAKDSGLLPWNTTKTGLDQDSPLFRSVQQRMFEALQAVQSIINRMKSEVQTRPEDERPVSLALETATEVALKDLPESKRFQAPPPPPQRRPSSTPAHLINVLYKVDRNRMQSAMAITGLNSAAKVGEHTFYYFMRNEVEE